MVELDTHRIIDILESRESDEVRKWLQTYPNITVISRDGAQIYANASSTAHPSAIQVTDRFHLLLYALVKGFHRIVFSHKPNEIDNWISNAKLLGIPELNTYLGGLTNDILAVKNAISYAYNNGLAEGSVNKIKLAKRIMYGRNSFALLRAKLLLNEHFN